MSKDYRKKTPARSYQADSSSKMSWIVFLILIGLFFVIMLYWKQNEKIRLYEASTIKEGSINTEKGIQKIVVPVKPVISKPTAPITPSNTTTPEFDFYTVLPQMPANTTHPVPVKISPTASVIPRSVQPPIAATQARNDATTNTAPGAINTQMSATAAPASTAATTANKTAMTAESVETTISTIQKSAPVTAPVSQGKKAPQKSADTHTSVVIKDTAKEPPKIASINKTPEIISPQIPSPPLTVYLLQMASFKTYADADRLKAQLTMLGFDVYIQSYTSNNQVHNRVVMGPYVLKSAAIQAQTRLQKKQVPSILISNSR